MKRITNDQLIEAIKQLLDRGDVVIGAIRVNDGKNITSYTSLSACLPEHREGYRRALEAGEAAYFRDVVYDPVFMAKKHAKSIATLK